MDKRTNLGANLLLLVTAFLWGSSFAVRRAGLLYMSPFFFNSARFFVAFVFMVICLFLKGCFKKKDIFSADSLQKQIKEGLVVGIFYSAASALQQLALVTVSAGETGFLTSLYILFVPIIGLVFLKQRVRRQVWMGAFLAVAGLFLISTQSGFAIRPGTIYLLMGAVCYALQIIAIDRYVKNSEPLFLVTVQLLVGTAVNGLLALVFERETLFLGLWEGMLPVLYAGILSLGVANLLQFIAQKRLSPSAAAIICSFESIFGALTGAVLLGERMAPLQILGCGLIFAAMLISQHEGGKREK